MRTIGTPTKHMPSVVRIFISASLRSHPRFAIDSPEVGPGSTIAPSTTGTATSSSHPSSTQSTGSPTHTTSPGGGSSNTGAIVGGVVGGIAAICIAVVAILYQQRRSRAQPTVFADVVESKVLSSPSPPDEGTPAPSSLSGTPRLYVRDFVSRIALVCLTCHFFPISAHAGSK